MKRSREDLIRILVLADEEKLQPDDLINDEDREWTIVMNLTEEQCRKAAAEPHRYGVHYITLNLGGYSGPSVTPLQPLPRPEFPMDKIHVDEMPEEPERPVMQQSAPTGNYCISVIKTK